MKRWPIALAALATLATSAVRAAPAAGDAVSMWLKNAEFKKLYSKALAKSPVNHSKSWVYQDIGLAPSKAIAGQNSNTWVQLTTCGSKTIAICRSSHIDIFYDVQNQELFAYLSLGNRVGWIGGERGPTSLEQKFLTPYLTAKEIR